jgi:hypothetical protein
MPGAETSGNDAIATLLDCCCGRRIPLAHAVLYNRAAIPYSQYAATWSKVLMRACIFIALSRLSAWAAASPAPADFTHHDGCEVEVEGLKRRLNCLVRLAHRFFIRSAHEAQRRENRFAIDSVGGEWIRTCRFRQSRRCSSRFRGGSSAGFSKVSGDRNRRYSSSSSRFFRFCVAFQPG